MTESIDIHEAKAHLSELLTRVQAGEKIIITKEGRPVAQIVPIQPDREPRQPGSAKGRMWIAPDFDAPLPEEILQSFTGKSSKETMP